MEIFELIEKAIEFVNSKGIIPEFIFLPKDKFKTLCEELNIVVKVPSFNMATILIQDLADQTFSLTGVHPNLAEGFICSRAVMNEPTQQIFKVARVFTLVTLTEVKYENQPISIFSLN